MRWAPPRWALGSPPRLRTRPESRRVVGELRGAVLSLFASRGAVATETNPNYKGARRPRLRLLPRLPLRTGRATTNADFRALLRPQPDQHEERRQAQALMHLRHLANNELRGRSDHGGGRAHRHNRIRYFLDRPFDLCENWRTHEEYPAYILPTNRGRRTSTGCCLWDRRRARAGL